MPAIPTNQAHPSTETQRPTFSARVYSNIPNTASPLGPILRRRAHDEALINRGKIRWAGEAQAVATPERFAQLALAQRGFKHGPACKFCRGIVGVGLEVRGRAVHAVGHLIDGPARCGCCSMLEHHSARGRASLWLGLLWQHVKAICFRPRICRDFYKQL
jgi:hypothetical protein